MKERKAAFFQEVLLKTRAGRIRWQPTANDSAFCAIIPGGYAAGLASADSNGVERIALTLVELGQTLLTVVSVTDVSEREMDELFALAQAQTEQADSKVDTAIEALANL
jgi:hypothetical protein